MSWPEQFAPQAVRDLEDAVDWLASEGGPALARRLAVSTLEAAKRVTEWPEIGLARPDLLPRRFRTWSVRGFPYLIVYDAERSPVKIPARVAPVTRLPPIAGRLG